MNLKLTGNHVEITDAMREYVISKISKTDSEDMYASIDSLVDKLDRQILKHKEKNLERRNHGSLKDQDFEE